MCVCVGAHSLERERERERENYVKVIIFIIQTKNLFHFIIFVTHRHTMAMVLKTWMVKKRFCTQFSILADFLLVLIGFRCFCQTQFVLGSHWTGSTSRSNPIFKAMAMIQPQSHIMSWGHDSSKFNIKSLTQ